jgi:hypothetical protein
VLASKASASPSSSSCSTSAAPSSLQETGTRLTIEQEHGRCGFFDIFRGSQLYDDMESIFEKVLQTMPSRTRKDTRTLQSKIFFRPSGGTRRRAD